MELVLVLAAILLSSMLAAVRLALRSRAEALRLRAINNALGSRVAERTRSLRLALDAAGDQARALACANQAKSNFLAGMNHALRTPLNAVIGFADLMTRNAEQEPLTRKQSRALAEIRVAGSRLLSLIDRILEFSDMEAGAVAVSLERVDPLLVLRQAIEDVRAEAAARGVTLQYPAASPGHVVAADPDRLRQVLLNLISNAVRHNRPGGTVMIEVRQVGDRVTLAVHDDGPGIEAERMEGLFQPFCRLSPHEDRPDADGEAVLGVGLAVAHRLTEAMGGTLTAASTPGEGSSFTLTLPVALATPATIAAPEIELEGSRDLSDLTVLYIEDNAANITLMRHVMSALGPSLHVAETGTEGVALARDLRPDVILLDIHLPDFDGFEVKARLAEDTLTQGLPVVALTAGSGPAEARRGREAGFADWLAKPLDIARLATILRQVAGPQPQRRAA
ncbi:hybrid sensor histidine kinase/response regulator [Brevundimonas sp.]